MFNKHFLIIDNEKQTSIHAWSFSSRLRVSWLWIELRKKLWTQKICSFFLTNKNIRYLVVFIVRIANLFQKITLLVILNPSRWWTEQLGVVLTMILLHTQRCNLHIKVHTLVPFCPSSVTTTREKYHIHYKKTTQQAACHTSATALRLSFIPCAPAHPTAFRRVRSPHSSLALGPRNFGRARYIWKCLGTDEYSQLQAQLSSCMTVQPAWATRQEISKGCSPPHCTPKSPCSHVIMPVPVQ